MGTGLSQISDETSVDGTISDDCVPTCVLVGVLSDIHLLLNVFEPRKERRGVEFAAPPRS